MSLGNFDSCNFFVLSFKSNLEKTNYKNILEEIWLLMIIKLWLDLIGYLN